MWKIAIKKHCYGIQWKMTILWLIQFVRLIMKFSINALIWYFLERLDTLLCRINCRFAHENEIMMKNPIPFLMAMKFIAEAFCIFPFEFLK